MSEGQRCHIILSLGKTSIMQKEAAAFARPWHGESDNLGTLRGAGGILYLPTIYTHPLESQFQNYTHSTSNAFGSQILAETV